MGLTAEGIADVHANKTAAENKKGAHSIEARSFGGSSAGEATYIEMYKRGKDNGEKSQW